MPSASKSAAAKARQARVMALKYADPAFRAEKLAKMKRTHHERYYGISRTEYESLCAARGNLCDVCDGPPVGGRSSESSLVVDHDHTTGRIRGLLCNNCNTAIGLMKDDKAIVLRVAMYLEPNVSLRL